MNAQTPIVTTVGKTSVTILRIILALALAALVYNAIRMLGGAIEAVRFPGELDYGEGIVWEQMRLMVAGRAYGAIDGFPAIVFHYPPVYHSVTAIVAGLTGWDELVAGRSVSLGSTVLISVVAGWIASTAVGASASRRAATLCGMLAGLAIFCCSAVVLWAPYMRVDMLSVALSLAGLLTAMKALRQPKLIVLAAFFFVAAVYTKQIALAAPAAVIVTLLLARPRLAWALVAGCLVLGLTVLIAMQIATDGGFARHIFLYNVNRFDPSRMLSILISIVIHIFFTLILLTGLVTLLKERLPRYRGLNSFAEARSTLRSAPADIMLVMLGAYAFFACLMSLAISKSGSNVNYFVDGSVALSILVGIVSRPCVEVALGERQIVGPRAWENPLLVPALILLQVFFMGSLANAHDQTPAEVAELRQVQVIVDRAEGPVISDDMVLVMRAGKDVVWEPAIFAELAKVGVWDESDFLRRIDARQFSLFVTQGSRGRALFDARYNETVIDAIDRAYPVKREIGKYTIHYPHR
ncbi:hypothetical protein SH584_03000 [Sphingomonas sp. LY29]|uniref:ArnT family glycosyltransferase n=1 Tax=Sphingomonas sp. LY29 TaxID=3095341 RepID=UPI002D77FF41|nr:hypothetical protein [Sphingomonas sp. LY29]WRP26422.1 hypothetical protein SH584_03000 [Sphingomonas sp. LY29]